MPWINHDDFQPESEREAYVAENRKDIQEMSDVYTRWDAMHHRIEGPLTEVRQKEADFVGEEAVRFACLAEEAALIEQSRPTA